MAEGHNPTATVVGNADDMQAAFLALQGHKPSAMNEFNLHTGQNLPNHSTSLVGRGRYVRQGHHEIPTFRTRQAAYRYAAWLVQLAGQHLPNEEGCEGCTFDAVREAVIENS